VTPNISIGTSNWQHPEWLGTFYPADLGLDAWLNFYANAFSHVEISESFYELPERARLLHWLEATPDSFVFTLTAPRTITHGKKLKNCENQTNQLLTRLDGMEHRIKNVLFRLPTHWHCNLRRLEVFLSRLPTNFRYVLEFGDASWYTEPVYAVLTEHNATLCIQDSDVVSSPLVSTADSVYVRLNGPKARKTASYHVQTLRSWGVKARGWQRKSKQVFLSFGGAMPSAALKNAQRMRHYCE
jgi:uncharacterized protein YecE (DUF72 family)